MAKPTVLIRTQSELAERIGRDEAQVSRYVRDERWTFGRAPWKVSQVPEIQRWIADELRNAADQSSDESESGTLRRDKLRNEVRKLLAQAETAETALAKERGALLDAADVEHEHGRLAALVRTGFENLPSQLVSLALAQGMPHQAAPHFTQQAETLIASILRKLSNDGTEDNEADAGTLSAEPVSA